MKNVIDHPEIKKYRKQMIKEKRCIQCINPWYDGTCGCGKEPENREKQKEIAILAVKLIYEEGWKG